MVRANERLQTGLNLAHYHLNPRSLRRSAPPRRHDRPEGTQPADRISYW